MSRFMWRQYFFFFIFFLSFECDAAWRISILVVGGIICIHIHIRLYGMCIYTVWWAVLRWRGLYVHILRPHIRILVIRREIRGEVITASFSYFLFKIFFIFLFIYFCFFFFFHFFFFLFFLFGFLSHAHVQLYTRV